MPNCVMCEKQVERWLPYALRDRRSPLMGLLDVIGSDLDNYQCPDCGSNDRERHVWLYMAAVGLLTESVQHPILHIAPEAHIERRLRACARSEYVAGDLSPRDPRHARIDIENLDFESGKFHLIICNHVLEHVGDAARAIRELARCLADDGWLIAQTPYSTRLKDTMEFVTRPKPEAATLFFGQDDHVRLFGANIGELFAAAGLKGGLYPHEMVLPQLDAAAWGCNPREPFFVFSKTRWLTAAN